MIDKDAATKEFNTLKIQEDKYYNTSLPDALNSIGYQLLITDNDIEKAIEIFEYATLHFPDNPNLYDSLGEAYFINKNYDKALLNYKKSLELNPNNGNAKTFISKLNELKSNP